MRQNLLWFPQGKNDEFKTLNTRKTKDELLPSDLQSISNFTFDELGGIKKIKGNSVLSTSLAVTTTTSDQPAESDMVDCYWDSDGDVQNTGNLKSDVIGLKFQDSFFAALSGTVTAATLYLTTVTSDTFTGIAYENSADFTEASASPPANSTATSSNISATGASVEHSFSLPTTWIDNWVSTNYGLQIEGAGQDGYFFSSLGGIAYPTEILSHWKMDETTGDALDALSVNDLTETGTVPAVTAGIIDGARGPFSASNTFGFDSGGSAATVYDNDSFIVDFFVKFTGNGLQHFIGKHWGISGWIIREALGTNSIEIKINRNSYYVPGAYNDGEWHHIGAVFTPACVRVYIDGIIRLNTATTTLTHSIASLGVGSTFDGAGGLGSPVAPLTTGPVDDVAYWDSAPAPSVYEALFVARWDNGNGRGYA